MLSDRIGDRRILLIACAMVGLVGMLVLPWFATNWTLMAAMLFVWGGVRRGALHDRPCASRLPADRPRARLGQRRLRVLLRLRHADRPAGDRHRHGRSSGPTASAIRWRCSSRSTSCSRWRAWRGRGGSASNLPSGSGARSKLQIPDPSSCSASSPSQGVGIPEVMGPGARLALGSGIQHFNSGSA